MRRCPNPWLALAIGGSVVYPLLVYFEMSRMSPGVVALIGVALIGSRLAGMRGRLQSGTVIPAVALMMAGMVLTGLMLFDPPRAALAYPIVISLSTAMVFGLSLVWPPTVVERIVRVREPDLSPAGVDYTRKVTIVWTGFLIANAATSAVLAIRGSIAQWTLWNGLISYVLMGGLFLGEMAIRRIVRRRAIVS